MATLSSTLRISLLDRVTGRARGIMGTLGRLQAAGDRVGRSSALMLTGGALGRIVALGGAYVGATSAIRGTAGAAMNFESAFADVRKVIDGTPAELSALRDQVLGLSKEIPIAADGFAAIFAAAGQSGIAKRELRTFAEMTAKVATAWDVSADETGQSLAEMKAALGRDVSSIGLLADAINHLSNISAANAPRLLEYEKRVASFAETAGFSAEQAAAFGAAMIGSGFEPEVAATSFRNLSKSLTAGESATKKQRAALKLLGLDAVKVAKRMQEDAVGVTLETIDAIAELPEWQRVSIAEQIFGSEARGLAPLFSNTAELRRLLGEIGDQAKFAGSAFREYEARAKTTANTVQLLGNNFRAMGIELGDRLLPGINEAASGMLDLFKTLGERSTPLSQLSTAVAGLSAGLGYSGGLREFVNDLGDLVLGSANGGAAADQLGRLYARTKAFGEDVRAFGSSISETVASIEQLVGLDAGGALWLLGDLAGYGATLAAAAIGFGLFAGAVTRLGSAILFLSGLKTAAGALKWIGKAGFGIGGAAAGTATAGAGAAAAGGAAGLAARGGGLVGLLSRLVNPATLVGGIAAWALMNQTNDAVDKDLVGDMRRRNNAVETLGIADANDGRDYTLGAFGGFRRPNQAPAAGGMTNAPLAFRRSDEAVKTLPSGVQDVRITNPTPAPNVSFSITVNHSSTEDPAAVGRKIGQAAAEAIGGVYSDSGVQ